MGAPEFLFFRLEYFCGPEELDRFQRARRADRLLQDNVRNMSSVQDLLNGRQH